ncbi:NUDIX hydrolase [Agromyces kandeliae]|uniref:NUDIX domain-containing protein n=1 Tax=Agromyces kandeliae TaxID=2666141 RepID=A0A6L5QYH5_9MICO|nr:NUDIX hydrolase [Agromyces kandeliae]MRX42218.1 NUDIX domain-containing protein [Agromyces kandeliae]
MHVEVDSDGEPTVGSAATVVILRQGARGVEVLLGERTHRGSFAGAWVFPGGAVDESDAAGDPIDSASAARRAAVRETLEEVGLELVAEDLVEFALWSPPKGVPKRMRTRFFAARAPVPSPEIRLAADELVQAEWLTPTEALEHHADGAMTLFPPTWVTLHELRTAPDVDTAIAMLDAHELRAYVGRFDDDRTTLYWQEDEHFHTDDRAHRAVPDDGPDADGPRHRLMMDRLPWVYLHSF